MNRFGAFLIHLGISLAIFAVLASLVVFVWYPDFFFTTDGGWQGIRIIVLVDLVLGPLLTLVVFNRNKPRTELRRDLALIGTFQLACLTAGTYVVWSERPLALVYVDGAFYSMSTDSYREAGVEVPDLSEFPGPWPKRLVVKLPEDYGEQSEIRSRALRNRVPLRALVERYEPFKYQDLRASKEAVPQENLRERDGELMYRWVSRHGGTLDDYAFFPYGARYAYVFIGVSTERRSVVGVLDLPFAGTLR